MMDYVVAKRLTVFVPDLRFGRHRTNLAAKRAFMERHDPELVGATDDLVRAHFDAASRNLGLAKVLRVPPAPPPHVVRSARAIARALDAHPLTDGALAPWALAFEAFGPNFGPAACRSLFRELERRGLLRVTGRDDERRFFARRPDPLDDVALGTALAAELLAAGRGEALAHDLATASDALALQGLHGRSAVDRLVRLRHPGAPVRVDDLAGQTRVRLP